MDSSVADVSGDACRACFAWPPAADCEHIWRSIKASKSVNELSAAQWRVPIVRVLLRLYRSNQSTVLQLDKRTVMTRVVADNLHLSPPNDAQHHFLLIHGSTLAAEADSTRQKLSLTRPPPTGLLACEQSNP